MSILPRKAINRKAPTTRDDWLSNRDLWIRRLKGRSFRGWPTNPGPTNLLPAASVSRDGITLSTWDFVSQETHPTTPLCPATGRSENQRARPCRAQCSETKKTGIRFSPPSAQPSRKLFLISTCLVSTNVHTSRNAKCSPRKSGPWAYVCPRGVGPTAFNSNERKRTHIRRRFMLLGQTQDGMQTWDIKRAHPSSA